jgi:hypothetical protein
MWFVILHNMILCTLTRPYPVTLLPIGSGYFPAKPSLYYTPTFLKPNSFYTHLPAYKMEQSVPKRRHIKFRRRGNTYKKGHNIYESTLCTVCSHPHDTCNKRKCSVQKLTETMLEDPLDLKRYVSLWCCNLL